MDFSMWMQSPSDWGMLFFSALLIGMSKTGVQGISLLAVPLMAGKSFNRTDIANFVRGGFDGGTILSPHRGMDVCLETTSGRANRFCNGTAG